MIETYVQLTALGALVASLWISAKYLKSQDLGLLLVIAIMVVSCHMAGANG